MSKFAAIEARATQYPANANDVVWLVGRLRLLRDALVAIRDNGCRDSAQCGACMAIDALEAFDEPNTT